MAFSLLGNKIGGINDITANHQCAFKPGYGTFAEKPATSHNNRRKQSVHLNRGYLYSPSEAVTP